MSKTGSANLGVQKRERATLRRQKMQDDVRAKMSAVQYIRSIERIAEDLIQISDSLKRLKKGIDADRASKYHVQINALDKAARIKLSLLRKVLPDLKSLELSDPEGKNPLSPLADVMREAIEKARSVIDEDYT